LPPLAVENWERGRKVEGKKKKESSDYFTLLDQPKGGEKKEGGSFSLRPRPRNAGRRKRGKRRKEKRDTSIPFLLVSTPSPKGKRGGKGEKKEKRALDSIPPRKEKEEKGNFLRPCSAAFPGNLGGGEKGGGKETTLPFSIPSRRLDVAGKKKKEKRREPRSCHAPACGVVEKTRKGKKKEPTLHIRAVAPRLRTLLN